MSDTKTAIVLVVDRSGSMASIKNATEDALKEFVNQQKAVEGDFTIDTVFFDNEYEERAVMIDPRKDELDLTIQPRGMTAMLDAIGRKITSFNLKLDELKDNKPENVLFVIATDGMENSSREYTNETVAALIKEKQDAGWNFTFIGANQDAISTAARLNIGADSAITFDASETGVESVISSMSSYTTKIRRNVAASYSPAEREAAVAKPKKDKK